MGRIATVLHALTVFYFYLSSFLSTVVHAADPSLRTYTRGSPVPVTCLNRTIETGEHITDAHGQLQYIPFLRCNESSDSALSFSYGVPSTQTCTMDMLGDEFYHLLEYFVHSDVPLSCRVPSWPIDGQGGYATEVGGEAGEDASATRWTPLTIALQGTYQLSHLHLQTTINVLFHTAATSPEDGTTKRRSGSSEDANNYLIAATAYSIPTPADPPEGAKIVRNEPLKFTFNVGWIEGSVLPGMVGRPALGVKDHGGGFSLVSFFAVAGSAGVGALGMLFYERRKRGGRGAYGNGLLGGNVGGIPNGVTRSSGYGGYGGYGGYSGASGKRD